MAQSSVADSRLGHDLRDSRHCSGDGLIDTIEGPVSRVPIFKDSEMRSSRARIYALRAMDSITASSVPWGGITP